jgi:hypothetical protein
MSYWKELKPYYPGAPRRLQEFERREILHRIAERPKTRLTVLTDDINDIFYGDLDAVDGLSYSTVRRTLIRAGLSRKGLHVMNNLVDHGRRYEYFQDLSHVHPHRLVDLDGMAASRKQFEEKYGWSPIGEDAILMQLALDGRMYSVVSAYTPFGFLCWEIFVDEAMDAAMFQNFLRERLQPLLRDNDFGILDNASVHKTDESLQALEDVFQGRFRFSVEYCFIDKPIERGYSNIKNFIRGSIRNGDDIIAKINEAFELYSVNGLRGRHAYHHFDRYIENHERFLQDMRL